MFVVTKQSRSFLSSPTYFEPTCKKYFYFPNTTPHTWQLIGARRSRIMGVRRADTIFHADLGRVKQPLPSLAWCQLAYGETRLSSSMKTSLKYNPILVQTSLPNTGYNRKRGVLYWIFILRDMINIQGLRILNCSQCELLWMRYLWVFMMIMWHKKQIYISHYPGPPRTRLLFST